MCTWPNEGYLRGKEASVDTIIVSSYLFELDMNSLSLHKIMQPILSGLSRAVTALLIPTKGC
jgi:hypothetical protein